MQTHTVRQILSKSLYHALEKAREKNLLWASNPSDISVEHPQKPEHGDYATSLPMKIARSAGINPMVVASKIIELLPQLDEVSEVKIAPPGFINFKLSDSWLNNQVEKILGEGREYGEIDLGKQASVQVEYVSVNPTGPLHVGHGRGAILGSTLVRVLRAAGYKVSSEYYINDTGAQVKNFSRSLYARYNELLGREFAIPENGYFGDYMIELAKTINSKNERRFLELPEDKAVEELGEAGIKLMLQDIERDLKRIGVEFDLWFSERTLFENGQYLKIMELLKNGGHLTEKEDAVWFTSSILGDDRDNVVVRSDGSPTYFVSDIAYHYNKFVERKFDRAVDIWGADHQGHVSRMKVVMNALGIEPSKLKIIICQLVTLKRGNEVVRVSKRSGDLITLAELVDDVGVDACRFFFLSRSADSQMDFDIELAKKESAENPVYYVQYAHARIASILRLAEEKGLNFKDGDTSLLVTEPELALIRKMILLPEIIATVTETFEPHHLTYYAQELATYFHVCYKQCRVISEDVPLTLARLKLVKASKMVLANTLNLMGMSSPERM